MRRLGALLICLVAATAACGNSGGGPDAALARQARLPFLRPAPAAPEPEPLVAETVPTPPPAPPATPAPTTTEAPPPPPPPAASPAPSAGTEVYGGLGTWIDVYDWSRTFGKDGPLVEVGDVDRMADLGVQTLYVQASKWDSPTDVLEPERLLPIVSRARERGVAVVAWYLPTLEDPATDLRRLLAIAAIGVDGLAVDIESRKVADVAERNRRLVQLSADLRAALPGTAIGAIPLAPVHIEVVNPGYWPGFPWTELRPYYDVWLPMAYQSERKASSGYRDGYRYTAENVDRLRTNLGDPTARVHIIGGIADRTSTGDVQGMQHAAAERGVMGGSLYDWRTTGPELWASLQGFRAPGR